ncbi:MAG TPA: 8-amino-7-oxononanoate synthase [Candidatus Binatia bacterium]
MTLDFIARELAQIRGQGLYRRLRRVEGPQGPFIRIDGREVLNLSSNNYLGLADHPALAAAARKALDRFGCGSGASRLISGNTILHEELEHSLGRWKGTEAALVFNSGYQANIGILSTLVGAGDIIFSDALNHASLIDGCRLSRAKIVVYPHLDVNRLESALRETAKPGRKLIVTETVFSMDGDRAPLGDIVELAEKNGAMVMVDEAHATGVFGPSGAGVVEELGLSDRILVQMGTLGKALGGFGAYVAVPGNLRELLINRCRSFIFTTSLPPAVIAMALSAIEVAQTEPHRRAALQFNCRLLQDGLKSLAFSLGPTSSQILPLLIGEASTCMAFAEALLNHGVYAQGIRPPTVPPGTSRLRITPMASHTEEQLRRALAIFKELKDIHDHE